MVAFSPNVGSALNSAIVGLLGSVLGGALGMLIISLISGLALGYSYQTHPVAMVRSLHQSHNTKIWRTPEDIPAMQRWAVTPSLAFRMTQLSDENFKAPIECI